MPGVLITGEGDQNAPQILSSDAGAFQAAFTGGGSYILHQGSCLAATAINANTVQISDGLASLHGRWYRIRPGEIESVAISNGGQGVRRNDLIALRYEIASGGRETVDAVVIEGTPHASSPQDPSVQTGDILAGDLVAEIPLYRVRLNGISIDGIDRLLPVSDRGMKLTLAGANFTTGKIQAYTSVPLASGQGFYYTDAAGIDHELSYTGSNGKYTLSGISDGMTIWVGEK